MIGSQMEEQTVPEGSELTLQGRPVDSFYVIVRGRLEPTVDGRSHGDLGPGDFVGEISMLEGGAASATITAREPTQVLAISQTRLREFAEANSWLLTRLLATMDLRQRKDYEAWRQSRRPARA